ncbi:hypothetical protein ACIRD8_35100 [Streptomyces sp. NPDC102451]|uniref:hypothetical protein n=1 Tax=Streptomyces sp. NPDC102451 TaxID=3366177 RepID=UPI00382E9E29
MSDAEKSLRDRLRRIVDGAPVDEQPQPPLVQVHVIPEPTAAPAAEDLDDEDDQEDEQPEKSRPWWYVVPRPFGTRPTPEPAPTPQEQTAAAPGIHVTVNQPAQQPPWTPPVDTRAEERLHRRRIWVVYHLGAAGCGWVFGLPQQMGELIADAGRAGAAVGIALGLVTWIVASYLPGLPYMPPALRPVLVWAARIPVCSAAIALALYAPGTV